MEFRLRVEVRLKPGHSDPEGEATAHLLKELGYEVETVSVGKVYTVALEAESEKRARMKAEEMCKRLLANPTKDDYFVNVEEKR